MRGGSTVEERLEENPFQSRPCSPPVPGRLRPDHTAILPTSGANALLPNADAIRQVLQEALGSQ